MLQELSVTGLTLDLHVYYCPCSYRLTNKYRIHLILVLLKIIPKANNTTKNSVCYYECAGHVLLKPIWDPITTM
jgi:hypothetical protein